MLITGIFQVFFITSFLFTAAVCHDLLLEMKHVYAQGSFIVVCTELSIMENGKLSDVMIILRSLFSVLHRVESSESAFCSGAVVR
jgi:hypothetical protein